MKQYDVFLSFKNSDAEGNATKEQRMAQELYAVLTSHGLAVFYSNASLLELGTAQYKAAIDSALDCAKILVAVGTSEENLSSSWVRYEWDSFYSDILSEQKQGLIVK